ncbi:hypothetical protein M422DRAFT_267369 [Sphaerobolus stellatus SS14]|uniref:F-box domain-containing protein n=1 Tax=Sphaerobolus stellatus (strain SS14) TaxID=990650 RepID=A0A0C9U984_SPHS4|nr:hypothetical protein M422DRAFT_267369 [Sphaerobolus stellatus SS14]
MVDLPFDIWTQIAQQLLIHCDLLNLSQICRFVRSAAVPLIFETATFSVRWQSFEWNQQACFAQVCHSRARIAFCAQNKTILSALRRVQILYWSPVHVNDLISLRLMVDGKQVEVSDIRLGRDANKNQYVNLSRSLREALNTMLATMYQELADLIDMAPNLGPVSIFEIHPGAPGFSHRNSRSPGYPGPRPLVPTRYLDPRSYKWFEFNAQDGSARADRMQSILPVAHWLSESTYNVSPPIYNVSPSIYNVSPDITRSLFDILEYIRAPIFSVALDVGTLAELPPAALAKIRSVRHVSIHYDLYIFDPSRWEHLANILDTVNGHQDRRVELSFDHLLQDCPAVKQLPLHQLTSFRGTFKLLCDISPFASNLESIQLADIPDDHYHDHYLNVLRHNPMTRVYHLGLPFRYKFERLEHMGNLWPSIEDLSIGVSFSSSVRGESDIIVNLDRLFKVLSYYPNIEVLQLWAGLGGNLRQRRAFDLHITPRPPNCTLRSIEFSDLSIAYWNSLDGIWEFDIHRPLLSDMSDIPISLEEATTANKVIRDCWTTWYYTLPKSTLRKQRRMAIQRFFGKGRGKKNISIFTEQ